jgi:RNA-directed DNA polymerase
MHGHKESDLAIVAVKPANKVEQLAAGQPAVGPTAAEPGEPRAGTKGNADQQSTCRTQSRVSVSQALDRIRRVARERKKEKFTALYHHISIELLDEAFHENAAPGVDRLTWKDYEADLERNLEDLHDRVQRGAYRALPSRRVYIPKPDGRQRPLAVAALEDKIVQRAVVALLNAIYEADFPGVSYGFRPGRGTHDAVDALCVGIDSKKVSFILDADIRSFFDEINQQWLIRFLEHRIGDRRIIRLIQKWLKAGVMENGVVTVSDRGIGQGSVISPLLANIYLHYVLDLWALRWRRRQATGDMIFVRYADDFIVGFQHESDARRFLDEMRDRLGKFALSLHPEKTRLIEFGDLRQSAVSGAGSANRKPSTSWASPSSAAKLARASSRLNGEPELTACERSSRWFKRKCGGACTSPSPIKGRGCTTLSVATSTITRCPRIRGHSCYSEPRSLADGAGYSSGAASGRSSIGNR